MSNTAYRFSLGPWNIGPGNDRDRGRGDEKAAGRPGARGRVRGPAALGARPRHRRRLHGQRSGRPPLGNRAVQAGGGRGRGTGHRPARALAGPRGDGRPREQGSDPGLGATARGHRLHPGGLIHDPDRDRAEAQRAESATAHLATSKAVFLRLVEKVRSFPEQTAAECIAARDYEALERLVLEHLLGG